MNALAPLPSGSWLGVLGGGQLGRMFCQAAQALGYRVAVLDPAPDGPAARVADQHLQAAYDDRAALEQLARRCVALTTEFENVPADSLQYLVRTRVTAPSARAVAIAQDRIQEKTWFQAAGVAVAAHAAIGSDADLSSCSPALFPGILKTSRLGYDGKGQVHVQDAAAGRAAFAQLQRVPCILEALQPLDHEISVIVVRGRNGQAVAYPAIRNRHRDGILAVSLCDGSVPADLAAEAGRLAMQVARHLDYHGVLCIEFFVLEGGRLLANEMAPRPHNSGHLTQDACLVSQFEHQARVLAGLPLGDTGLLCPAAMVNLLGDLWQGTEGEPVEPDWAAVLQVPGTRLHLYGKDAPRVGRKMGHVNILAPTAASLHERVAQVMGVLGLPHA
ncbi:5-(carboxyamino)imidazole ribonucleotide synthase [Castellaniella sp.]|uniref:5-(carboxyamino)imidazole ribonucleotide synthase n=1 Tax=Castellaniella sp. TaxID=1955812 RepID=UPI00355E7DEB